MDYLSCMLGHMMLRRRRRCRADVRAQATVPLCPTLKYS